MISSHTVITITTEDIAWAKGAVEIAKQKFPDFCREGVSFGCDKRQTPWEDSSLPQVVVAKHWLETCKPVRTTALNSYSLKHVAESWAGHYVSNAALIAAACGLGFTQKQCDPTSPDTMVGISKKCVPSYEDRKQCVDQVILEAQ